MQQSPSWEADRFSASQEILRILWKRECSLPHSLVRVTCPYPGADQSSPYSHIQRPEDPPKYYPPIYAWVFEVVSFPQVSLPKPFIHLSSRRYVLHVLPISFFSIWSPEYIGWGVQITKLLMM